MYREAVEIKRREKTMEGKQELSKGKGKEEIGGRNVSRQSRMEGCGCLH